MSSAFAILTSISSISNGFCTKSNAPALMSSTAVETDPNAVMRITAVEGVERLCALEHIESGAPSHLQVADDYVEKSFVKLLDGGVAVRSLFDVVRRVGECLDESPAEGIVVIRDQYPTHELHPRNNEPNSVIRNLPPPLQATWT